MLSRFKTIVIAVFAVSFLSGINAQINLRSNQITFRDWDNASGRSTHHYGDLYLDGGNGNSVWGWLWSNRVISLGEIEGQSLWIWGTKNFIHPHPTDTTKIIKYIAVESGEAITLARGTSKTTNGKSEIPLPEHFSLLPYDNPA